MRTTIDIDDQLMRAALKATGLKTKKAAVDLGLQTLIKLWRQSEIRKFRAKLNCEGDFAESRSFKEQ